MEKEIVDQNWEGEDDVARKIRCLVIITHQNYPAYLQKCSLDSQSGSSTQKKTQERDNGKGLLFCL